MSEKKKKKKLKTVATLTSNQAPHAKLPAREIYSQANKVSK